jgi:hypothetical protein
LKRISIKGIVLGSIAGIITSIVLTMLLLMYVKTTYDFSKSHGGINLSEIVDNDSALFPVQLFIDSFSSALGGYIAARLAKHDELLNGALTVSPSVSIGLYVFLSGLAPMSDVLELATTVALAICGAYFGAKKNNLLASIDLDN